MFRSILENLVREVAGARWAIVVGADGVVLEAGLGASGPGVPVETLAAEYALFMKACEGVLAQTGGETLDGFTLSTAESKVVLQPLTPEYFLVMGLDSSGMAGQARHKISRIQPDLERRINT